MNKLQVGAGKAEIRLAEVLFPNHENFVRILDPLSVRVVLISAEKRMAIVSLELTSLMGGVNELRRLVGDITDTDPDYVWITTSHTFSAPHIMLHSDGAPAGPGGPPPMSPEELAQSKQTGEALLSAVKTAAQTAKDTLKDAVMRRGTGYCDINTGRDVETAEGWWLGEGSTEYADKTLPCICFDDAEGKLIAIIYNYAIQSSVLDHAAMPGGGFLVSGDISGEASRFAEDAYPGSVALFLCGAAGDQAPRRKASTGVVDDNGALIPVERGTEGIALKEELGRELGRSLWETAAAAKPCEQPFTVKAQSISFPVPAKIMPDRKQLKASRSFSYEPDGCKEANVEVLQLGDTAFVGVKPELSAVIGTQIRDASPFGLTLVATMVNGGAKYMADELAYARNTYAAQNSPFASGAAELLRDQATLLLKKIAIKG